MYRHSRTLRQVLAASLLTLVGTAAAAASSVAGAPFWQAADAADREDYIAEPVPAGVQVLPSELFGPVFATEDGRTLYIWPLRTLRNGDAGDRRNSGVSACDDTVHRETAGLMSPYPPGYLLPELDKRKSCSALWPALLADEDATPVGKWTIASRTDGHKQWAYDGYPVYTSVLDRAPGDVYGGPRKHEELGRGGGGEVGAVRAPIGPKPAVPPELRVRATSTGRMLTDDKGFVVYTSDADEPDVSRCSDSCLQTWRPILAPQLARSYGDWSVVERSPGILQWAYRQQPLYVYIPDTGADVGGGKVNGSDVPGWRIAFTQRGLPPPGEFTVSDVEIGQVLAAADGRTIYVYNCNDDAIDQLSCNHPDFTQVYRLAVCGAGDPDRCLQTFPYVIAPQGASSASRLWSVMSIDPRTGHRATAGTPGALNVWAYLDRPVYTFGEDRPGEVNADAWGEFNGYRNGYKAFWLRDDFRNNAY